MANGTARNSHLDRRRRDADDVGVELFFVIEDDGEIMRCRQSASGRITWMIPISWIELQAQHPDYAESVEETARQAGLSLR